MTTNEIKSFIINALEQHGPLPNDNLDDFNFVKSGHIDSLAIMKFIINLEAEFAIKFSDEELLSEGFMSVNSLAELVFDKRQK